MKRVECREQHYLDTCSTITGDDRDREQLRWLFRPSRDLEASYA